MTKTTLYEAAKSYLECFDHVDRTGSRRDLEQTMRNFREIFRAAIAEHEAPKLSPENDPLALNICDHIETVLALARQNALDPETCDPDLQDEARRQREACDMVEDFSVNHLGDD